MHCKAHSLAFQMAAYRGLGTQHGCVKGRVVTVSWVEFVSKRDKKWEKANRWMPLYYVRWGKILRLGGSTKLVWKMYFGNKPLTMCFCETTACSVMYCLVYVLPISLPHWPLCLILPTWDCASPYSLSIQAFSRAFFIRELEWRQRWLSSLLFLPIRQQFFL